jgi:hypothetical protein
VHDGKMGKIGEDRLLFFCGLTDEAYRKWMNKSIDGWCRVPTAFRLFRGFGTILLSYLLFGALICKWPLIPSSNLLFIQIYSENENK